MLHAADDDGTDCDDDGTDCDDDGTDASHRCAESRSNSDTLVRAKSESGRRGGNRRALNRSDTDESADCGAWSVAD